jgi:hypothetical protein
MCRSVREACHAAVQGGWEVTQGKNDIRLKDPKTGAVVTARGQPRNNQEQAGPELLRRLGRAKARAKNAR